MEVAQGNRTKLKSRGQVVESRSHMAAPRPAGKSLAFRPASLCRVVSRLGVCLEVPCRVMALLALD